MSLILTHISKHGIVHASDSNLTSGSGSPAGQVKKTFDISFLKAGLTIAGSYGVGNENMDRWIDDFIQQQSQISGLSLKDFADNLKDALQQQMTISQKNDGSIVHIAGYVQENTVYHPEFYHVRNVHSINSTTGEYGNITQIFKVTEDFWNRDCPRDHLLQAFQSGAYQLYINGFASGRISYVMLQSVLNQFFSTIWNNPNWQFRPPQNLDETEEFMKLYMHIVNTLFLSSNYSAPFIGGSTQTLKIPAPNKMATSC